MNANRRLICWVLVVLLSAIARAHFPIDVSPHSNDGLVRVGWTPVQIGICASYPLQFISGDADVYGIAVGAVNLRQQSAIASLALGNGTQENYLAQVGLVDVCGMNWAFEVGLLNLTGRNAGVSVGGVNVESNFGYRGSIDPYPLLVGLQAGLFNVGGGVQVGLLNYNPHGIVKWLPFVNFPCGRSCKCEACRQR